MSDLLLFIQQGWKIIWKQKIIFIFSAYALSSQLFRILQANPNWRSINPILYLAGGFLLFILTFTGYIGVPYLVYCSSVEKSTTYQEALASIRKFAWRVLGCSCLSAIVLSPYFFWAFSVSFNSVNRSLQLSNKAILGSLFISAFTALFYFALADIFANNHGIFESAQEAWKLFTKHSIVMAVLGILISIVFRMYASTAGILTVLFQSNFDTSALGTLNIINPFATLSKNILFILLNSFGSIILTPLNAAIFFSAYQKYNIEPKHRPLSKARSVKI